MWSLCLCEGISSVFLIRFCVIKVVMKSLLTAVRVCVCVHVYTRMLTLLQLFYRMRSPKMSTHYHNVPYKVKTTDRK